ncbi:urease accessory protein UreF [Roseibium aquae]|nr:urease accessory protein UreF [Roseibium aquae]
MTDTAHAGALYKLLSFFSPAFPVGAFTYSHGLEQAVENGTLQSASDVERWLGEVVAYGAIRSDGILLVHAFRAVQAGDRAALDDLIGLGLALQPSRERYLESSAQGTAFMVTFLAAWSSQQDTAACAWLRSVDTNGKTAWPYPVAIGAAASASDLPVEETVTAYMQAFVSNLVSAAIRTVPLGQTQGQKVLATLQPLCQSVARDTLAASLDDLGSSSFLADIASMNHETQYTRLFRS